MICQVKVVYFDFMPLCTVYIELLLCFHGKYLNTVKRSYGGTCAGEDGLLPLRCQLYVHVLVRKAYCL